MSNSISKADRLAQQGGICYYCKQPMTLQEATRDHFLAGKFGYTLESNTVLAHKSCNGMKRHYTVDEWREKLIGNIRWILSQVIEQDWKITARQLKKLRKYIRILKTTQEIIDNGYRPIHIF